MTELEQLQGQSKLLWWVVVLLPLVGAMGAIYANVVRQWSVEPRIAALKAAAQTTREDALREEIARADRRTTEAEGVAARAGAAADEARQRADRHLPIAPSRSLTDAVRHALAAWASGRTIPLNMLWVGAGSPAMDRVVADLRALFETAHVPIGNTRAIGMIVGIPQGALILCDHTCSSDAAALLEALKPLIRNLELRTGPGPGLTLHLNGRPAFESNGAFTIE